MKEIQISTGFSQNDIGILGNFIGKKLVKIRHDTFDVDNTVMCVVELVFDDSTYCIINSLDAIR